MAIDISKVKKRQAALHSAMEDILKSDPWVEIKFIVDGVLTPFKLEYSFGAVQEIFRATGKNLNANEIQLGDMKDAETLMVLLTEGLKTHHPDMTVERVANMVRMRHLLYYLDRIQIAMQATQPDYTELEAMFGEIATEGNGGEEAYSPLPEVPPS